MLQKKRKINLGLIGLGQMGRNHLRVLSLLKGVQIKFIYDTNRVLSQAQSEIYGVETITNLNEPWPDIDAILFAHLPLHTAICY
jgi:predicted dehydrogenase